jgi:plasmid stabilization system protein ParE
MPSTQWSKKRERQYRHIKQGLLKSGRGAGEAEEIAARTVNKERAQHGESLTASRASLEDMPASRRGGLRSHQGAGGRTYRQLYEEAKARGIAGRSTMTKAQLQRKLAR